MPKELLNPSLALTVNENESGAFVLKITTTMESLVEEGSWNKEKIIQSYERILFH